ncbi:winged helix-turn-helix transcriptional regulator [Streptomyces cocklensis]|uniref:Transcriptional regulator, HxlR family n=1 Tax=Actinacidiphila cocklensis TaxID=887465 RepID=A0A9W4GTC3_9ACTN|nr:winged helix-turn-helix transcriptional regulator [Actinacidiphila cocklensis]MDD1061321.1 winged helix-turn-helix transcriptional regulator [Actinacidiphila cocklensis]WSX76841.1 winged helix-turn-helix transcriptional regulator [Streptomyces sp. NBC_00899]CAG6395648.1 Transcriptional regulator, HxlR family [Actinacidiphila cocklensis]
MRPKRTYGDGCGIARALDLVGERWALLVVRELVLGPKRFTGLHAGLPGVSPNVLAQRLRELEAAGVLRRRTLGPPAGARVYELTEWGQELEPLLVGLDRWGGRTPEPTADPYRSADSLMLWLCSRYAPAADVPRLSVVLAVRIGDDRFTVTVGEGALTVGRGVPERPDATLAGDLVTLTDVLQGRRPIIAAAQRGELAAGGDVAAVDRLVDVLISSRPSVAGAAVPA